MKQKYLIPLALAAVGIYFILKSKKGKVTPVVNPLPEPNPTNNSPKPKPTPTPTPASVDTWIVKTSGSNLNMRPTPSTSLAIIGSFPNGSEIKARPSAAVTGWHEVLDTSGYFPVVKGYVASRYLVKK